MRRIVLTLLAGLLLGSCAPQPVPVSTSTPNPTADAPSHAPEIRFALVGEPQDINVWQLFDESGASYADYALRFEYWPRLYHLTPPEFDFQPMAADGMPSAVIQEGSSYSAVIKLRTDLKWTDGKPFTAEDVAFTINTSLKYELGYDWGSYYSKEFLDRVEAVDPLTVKFYFKQKPNIKVWQYGALQGPILQKDFWVGRISEADILLPSEQLAVDIESAVIYLNSVQARVDDLSAQVNQLLFEGKENRQLTGDLVKKQSELGYANNTLNKLLDERAAAIESAQQALYAMDDTGEPTLGTWMPAGEQAGIWTNEANPDFPFVQPNFDKSVYQTYDDMNAALSAFNTGEVDVVIGPHGGPQIPSATVSPSDRARFLVFNPASKILSEPMLHRAIACMIDPGIMLPGQGQPLDGFIVGGYWLDQTVKLPCMEDSRETKIQSSIEMLKAAGYSWVQTPTDQAAGSSLILPDGNPFPAVTLLTTSVDDDVRRANIAGYLEIQLQYLGIPLMKIETDLTSLQYAIYSSKKYDMAIVGWRLSEYPGYLCEWFGTGGEFENNSDQLKSTCEALAVESDLGWAREQIFTLQSILSGDLPFIPLYTEATYNVFQNVEYPFEHVLGGLSGLYGAPSYAIPAK